MASKKASSDRKAKTAKAGKRHGMITYPVVSNTEKRAAKELGEQQFVAKKQQYTEKEVVAYDKKKMRFVTKTVVVPIDFTYDANRKRAVMSPVTKTSVTREKASR